MAIPRITPNMVASAREAQFGEKSPFSKEATGIPWAPPQEQIDDIIEALRPAVGDPNSDARGSGARWNAGKVPYDMLPLELLNDWLGDNANKVLGNGDASEVLAHIAAYQAGIDYGLDLALAAAAGDGVGLDRFAGAAQVFQHVTTREVKPYPKWNWTKGMKWSVPIGCIVRHALALQRGEEVDPETGYPHMWHIQCNLIMLLLYRKTYREGDDRPPRECLIP